MRALLIVALFLLPGSAAAGYAKQETEFHLDAAAAKVCAWIEHRPADLERAGGASVAAERDDYVKLDKSDEHGQYVFWVRRSGQRGQYRETLVESLKGRSAAPANRNPGGGQPFGRMRRDDPNDGDRCRPGQCENRGRLPPGDRGNAPLCSKEPSKRRRPDGLSGDCAHSRGTPRIST